ncbi:cytochrome c-type biogenesis protein CcmH [Demequina sp. SO4-13]|uniref:cytochrome c-type biogenesis protein CcmH n=1 Tax=Demequina sp. SO4-13 TaxID=3401027 RepID=UPI003AF6DA5A
MTASRRGIDSGSRMALLVTLGVIAAALAYAWLAPAPATADAAVRDVTTSIRCPTCIGESIADSTAPLSVAMRDEAERRLAAGESPGEVRAFFAEAYGPEVLLAPPVNGPGVVMWVAPVVVVAAVGAMAFIRARKASRPADRSRLSLSAAVGAVTVAVAATVLVVAVTAGRGEPQTAATAGLGAPGIGPAEALAVAVTNAPADADLRVALATALVSEGEHDRAAVHVDAAHRLRPTDPEVGHLRATLLLQEGEIEAAGAALDSVLDVQPEHAPTLLLRGIMLWRVGDAEGTELLERFLRLGPDDAAAEGVRELLERDAPA